STSIESPMQRSICVEDAGRVERRCADELRTSATLGDRLGAAQACRAVLLHGGRLSQADERIAKLLTMEGIACQAVSDTGAQQELAAKPATHDYIVLSSASTMAKIMPPNACGSQLPAWLKRARSVYIYGFDQTQDNTSLLRRITGDRHACIRGPISGAKAGLT